MSSTAFKVSNLFGTIDSKNILPSLNLICLLVIFCLVESRFEMKFLRSNTKSLLLSNQGENSSSTYF